MWQYEKIPCIIRKRTFYCKWVCFLVHGTGENRCSLPWKPVNHLRSMGSSVPSPRSPKGLSWWMWGDLTPSGPHLFSSDEYIIPQVYITYVSLDWRTASGYYCIFRQLQYILNDWSLTLMKYQACIYPCFISFLSSFKVFHELCVLWGLTLYLLTSTVPTLTPLNILYPCKLNYTLLADNISFGSLILIF